MTSRFSVVGRREGMGATQCPHCGLFNTATAITCDCGYDFAAGRAPETRQPDRTARRRREWRAFAGVPLAAAGAWYVLTLVDLAIVNGRLRLRTDFMAMGIGAVLVGLPVATAATILLSMPVYLVLRETPMMRPATVIAAGGALGLAVASVVSFSTNEWSLLPPWRGLGIGLAGAAIWWWRASVATPSRTRSI